MKKKIELLFDSFAVLFFLCLTFSCGQNAKPTDKVTFKNVEVINLSKEVKIKRHTDGHSKYLDILELNNLKIDSLDEWNMLDTNEHNIYIRSNNKIDTCRQSFVLFDSYLIISKDQVQVLGLQIYNLKTKLKFPLLFTEHVVVDTSKKVIFFIRDRGSLHNYILKYQLDNDKIEKLDSIDNSIETRKKMNIDINLK